MGYIGRRIGLSQDNGDSNPGGAGGAVGGGLLDLFTNEYFQRQGNLYNAPGFIPQGLTATGGVISDYTDGPAVYRSHIFTSSGTFDVTAPGDFGDTVDYLVVAGGGGGGGGGSSEGMGGGGAGGYKPGSSPVSITSYTITIGAGGASGDTSNSTPTPGHDTTFGSIARAAGGGRGAGLGPP